MKHPIQWILAIGGGSMLLAASLFGIGVFFDQPTCKTIAKWLWLLALVVAFIPLASLALMSVVERFRKK